MKNYLLITGLLVFMSCGQTPEEKAASDNQKVNELRAICNEYLQQPCMEMSYSEAELKGWYDVVNDSTSTEGILKTSLELITDKLAGAKADSSVNAAMNQ